MNDFKNRIQELAQEYRLPAAVIYTALAMVALISTLALATLIHSPTEQELQVAHQAVFNQANPSSTVSKPANEMTPAEQWEEQNRRDRDASLGKRFD